MNKVLAVIGVIFLGVIIYLLYRQQKSGSSNTDTSNYNSDTSHRVTDGNDSTTQEGPPYKCTVIDPTTGRQITISVDVLSDWFLRICRGEQPYQYQQRLYYILQPFRPFPHPHPHPTPPPPTPMP